MKTALDRNADDSVLIDILSRSSSRFRSSGSYTIEDLEEFINIACREQSIRTRRRNVREWRFIESSWFHDTMLSEVIDNQIHELQLVRSESLSVDKPGQGIFCSTPIHPHQRPHQETQPFGFLR